MRDIHSFPLLIFLFFSCFVGTSSKNSTDNDVISPDIFPPAIERQDDGDGDSFNLQLVKLLIPAVAIGIVSVKFI